MGLKASVGRVVFNPDGKRLATAGNDKVVRVWDVESGQELGVLPSPDRVTVVAFGPDGKSLAAGSVDGSDQGGVDGEVRSPGERAAADSAGFLGRSARA
jgi:WD40 repeat protein